MYRKSEFYKQNLVNEEAAKQLKTVFPLSHFPCSGAAAYKHVLILISLPLIVVGGCENGNQMKHDVKIDSKTFFQVRDERLVIKRRLVAETRLRKHFCGFEYFIERCVR